MGKTSETLNIDSLQEFNTKAALIRSMFFTPGQFDEEISRSDSAALIDYVLYHDSLRSTNGVYYYNPTMAATLCLITRSPSKPPMVISSPLRTTRCRLPILSKKRTKSISATPIMC